MKTKVIGIIGETGSGKSTVADYIQANYKAIRLDGDSMGHEVLEDAQVKKELVEHFSEKILVDGHVDRTYLGKIVFRNPDDLRLLNAITHPVIAMRMQSFIEAHQMMDLVLLDAAALIEAGIDKICDSILYIHASKEVRLERLLKGRHIEKERALSIMGSQKSSDFYRQHADFTCEMDAGIDDAKKTIDLYIREILC